MKSPRRVRAVWSDVQWPTSRAREWTLDLADRDSEIVAVIAIGSTVRGRARPGSDLDLVVVHRGERPNLRPPPEVDVRWVVSKDIEKLLGDGDDVIGWAVALGVALHDPTRIWSDLRSRWGSKVSLPSLSVSAAREARARRYAEELAASGDDDAAAEQVLSKMTHRARGLLARAGVFPLSRPELVDQLREAGENDAAELLENALLERMRPQQILAACSAAPALGNS